MAHYARLNSNNIVTYVTPIPNEMITDKSGVEHEEWAFDHLYSTIPDSVGDRWIQTSYHNNFRVRYAGIGYTYNEDLDAFVPPKPYDSWIFNEINADWDPPVSMSDDGNFYTWDENSLSWVQVVNN
jgi:hypothetical protein